MWDKHLREDEKPWVGSGRPEVETLLMRLAHTRALYENVSSHYSDLLRDKRLSTPNIVQEEDAELILLDDEGMAEDARLMAQCRDAGGCNWQPSVDIHGIFGGFPVLECTHCHCVKMLNPPMPAFP